MGCVPEAGIRSSDFYLFPLGPRGRTEHKKMELESWLEAGSRNLLGRLLQGLSAAKGLSQDAKPGRSDSKVILPHRASH